MIIPKPKAMPWAIAFRPVGAMDEHGFYRLLMIRQIGSGELSCSPKMAEATRLGRPRKLVSHMVNETSQATIARISVNQIFKNYRNPPHVQAPRIRF